MAVITRAYSESDGAIPEASSVNKVIDQLFTLQNGNLNSANLGTSVIGTSNLKDESVVTSKVAAGFKLSGEQIFASSIWKLQTLILGGY